MDGRETKAQVGEERELSGEESGLCRIISLLPQCTPDVCRYKKASIGR